MSQVYVALFTEDDTSTIRVPALMKKTDDGWINVDTIRFPTTTEKKTTFVAAKAFRYPTAIEPIALIDFQPHIVVPRLVVASFAPGELVLGGDFIDELEEIMSMLKDVPGNNAVDKVRRLKEWYREFTVAKDTGEMT